MASLIFFYVLSTPYKNVWYSAKITRTSLLNYMYFLMLKLEEMPLYDLNTYKMDLYSQGQNRLTLR